jgi:hypothetical protein
VTFRNRSCCQFTLIAKRNGALDRLNYLSTILARHLWAWVPQFRNYIVELPPDRVTPKDAVWMNFFADHEACVLELLLASHGNPRDALHLLVSTYRCFLDESPPGQGLMNIQDVYAGIKVHLLSAKVVEVQAEPYSMAVFQGVQAMLRAKAASKYMFVERSSLEERDDRIRALSQLEAARLIHPVSYDWRPSGKSEVYRLYCIDHAVLVDDVIYSRDAPMPEDRKKAAEAELSKRRRLLRDNGQIDDRNVRRYVLDFPPHLTTTPQAKGRARVCPKCEKPFSSKHPVFIAAGLCPNCAHAVAAGSSVA